jgi:hypothetical protein
MLQLSKAPFDIKSLTVLPAAGPCTTCLFRTGNQKELFDDIKGSDVCTKPACYDEKVASWWKSSDTKERKLSVAECTKLFPYEHSPSDMGYSTGYIDLAEKHYRGGKTKTYGELVGGQVEVFLALDRAYKLHRLATRAAVDAAINRHPDFKRAAASSNSRERQHKLDRAREKETNARISAAVEEQFQKDSSFDNVLCLRLWLMWYFLDRSWTLEDFLKARGVEVSSSNRHSKIVAFVDGLKDGEIWGVIFWTVVKDLLSGLKSHSKEEESLLGSILELWSVDHKAIAKQVKAEFDAKEKARAEKEKLKKAKAKKKAKQSGKAKAATVQTVHAPEPANEDDFDDVEEEIEELEEVEE